MTIYLEHIWSGQSPYKFEQILIYPNQNSFDEFQNQSNIYTFVFTIPKKYYPQRIFSKWYSFSGYRESDSLE